tara:strand:+ start:14407 stop:19233 length:4827 start_codon:yes stop_codon:yes gene_type:complete
MKHTLATIGGFALAWLAAADSVVLRDGQTLHGKLALTKDGAIQVTDANGTRILDAGKWKRVIRDTATRPPGLSGVEFKFYGGNWPKLPNFADLPADRSGVMSTTKLDLTPLGIVGTAQRLFDLRAGQVMSHDASPRMQSRPFTITAEVTATAPDGVILAQGGRVAGYAIYLEEGRLIFATRINHKLTTAVSAQNFPLNQPVTITAQLRRDAIMELTVNGQPVAQGAGASLLPSQPRDGLSVGKDVDVRVGPYKNENPFQGTIKRIRLQLEGGGVVYTGRLHTAAGRHEFNLNTSYAARLKIDGRAYIDKLDPKAPNQQRAALQLPAGPHFFQLEFAQLDPTQGGSQANDFSLTWSGPSIADPTLTAAPPADTQTWVRDDTATPGPGLLTWNGSFLPHTVKTIDADKVFYNNTSISRANVSIVLLQKLTVPKARTLNGSPPGVLLQSGDFVEGKVTAMNKDTITVESILIGRKTYMRLIEAVALVFNRPSRPMPGTRFSMRDGSRFVSTRHEFREGNIHLIQPPFRGRVLPFNEISEITTGTLSNLLQEASAHWDAHTIAGQKFLARRETINAGIIRQHNDLIQTHVNAAKRAAQATGELPALAKFETEAKNAEQTLRTKRDALRGQVSQLQNTYNQTKNALTTARNNLDTECERANSALQQHNAALTSQAQATLTSHALALQNDLTATWSQNISKNELDHSRTTEVRATTARDIARKTLAHSQNILHPARSESSKAQGSESNSLANKRAKLQELDNKHRAFLASQEQTGLALMGAASSGQRILQIRISRTRAMDELAQLKISLEQAEQKIKTAEQAAMAAATSVQKIVNSTHAARNEHTAASTALAQAQKTSDEASLIVDLIGGGELDRQITQSTTRQQAMEKAAKAADTSLNDARAVLDKTTKAVDSAKSKADAKRKAKGAALQKLETKLSAQQAALQSLAETSESVTHANILKTSSNREIKTAKERLDRATKTESLANTALQSAVNAHNTARKAQSVSSRELSAASSKHTSTKNTSAAAFRAYQTSFARHQPAADKSAEANAALAKLRREISVAKRAVDDATRRIAGAQNELKKADHAANTNQDTDQANALRQRVADAKSLLTRLTGTTLRLANNRLKAANSAYSKALSTKASAERTLTEQSKQLATARMNLRTAQTDFQAAKAGLQRALTRFEQAAIGEQLAQTGYNQATHNHNVSKQELANAKDGHLKLTTQSKQATNAAGLASTKRSGAERLLATATQQSSSALLEFRKAEKDFQDAEAIHQAALMEMNAAQRVLKKAEDKTKTNHAKAATERRTLELLTQAKQNNLTLPQAEMAAGKAMENLKQAHATETEKKTQRDLAIENQSKLEMASATATLSFEEAKANHATLTAQQKSLEELARNLDALITATTGSRDAARNQANSHKANWTRAHQTTAAATIGLREADIQTQAARLATRRIFQTRDAHALHTDLWLKEFRRLDAEFARVQSRKVSPAIHLAGAHKNATTQTKAVQFSTVNNLNKANAATVTVDLAFRNAVKTNWEKDVAELEAQRLESVAWGKLSTAQLTLDQVMDEYKVVYDDYIKKKRAADAIRGKIASALRERDIAKQRLDALKPAHRAIVSP